jgi:hypothetical protein
MRALALVVATAVLAPAAPAAADEEIIVRRDPGLDAPQRADVRADASARFVERLRLPDTEVVRVRSGDRGRAVRALEADPRVRYAEPNTPCQATASDPLSQPNLGVVRAPDAWTVATGSGVVVGVVDSGAALSH